MSPFDIPYTGSVRGLVSLVLASILLGVPRALDARAFGARRPGYVELSPRSPGLQAFGEALSRALAGRPAWSLSRSRREAATVVDVLALASGLDARGRRVEAVALRVSERGGTRRVLLHAAPGQREAAARELVARL
jgi:hypothetical protein